MTKTAPAFVEEAAANYEEEACSKLSGRRPRATYEPEPSILSRCRRREPVKAAEPLPSLDDPTTALERAIAALKAGDLAAFAREAQSDYVAPEPLYMPPYSS